MKYEWAQAYLRQLLENLTENPIAPDQDGDFPVQYLGAKFYARLVGTGGDTCVQVFSVAMANVPFDEDIATLLNYANTQTRFVRIFHVEQQILVESDIWAVDLNPANFEFACRSVAIASDELGKVIYGKVQGEQRFEESKSSAYQIGFV